MPEPPEPRLGDPALPDGLRVLLGRQHGACTTAQARAYGVTRDVAARRIARSEWVRPFRGVYLLAGSERLGTLQAALLYAGRGARLGYSSALEVLLGPATVDGVLPGDDIHVVIPGERRVAPQAGLLLHRAGVRPPADTRWHHGLPVTSLERSVVDLARHPHRRHRLEVLVCTVVQQRRTTAQRLEATAVRCGLLPRRRWFAALLADVGAGSHSLGELDFLRLLRRGRVSPLPHRQVPLGMAAGRPRFGDLGWPQLGILVEIDGAAFHVSVTAWEADLARANALALRHDGLLILRFTHRQIRTRPGWVLGQVRAALAQRTQSRRRAS